MVKIFDGKTLAREKEKQLATQLASLAKEKQKLKLVDVFFAADSKAAAYVRLKQQAASRVGIIFEPVELDDDFNSHRLLDLVKDLNNNNQVGGIMLQLPLPKRLAKEDREKIIETISPDKDVDCLTSSNLGHLLVGRERFRPATVEAVWQILMFALNGDSLIGRSVVIVGRSNVVGKPLANLLINQGATVTVCHSQTKDLASHTSRGEILILATNKDGLINQPTMVRDGAIVIDIGSPVGNVDLAKIKNKVSFITPVPGGVGPITVTSLLGNFLKLSK
jgi:methylenetetrahydrofolate dehydrogenase (NADP+)/methenyltetrahydrofolate cyclohydrolase